MGTTTIRIEDDLKSRIAAAAEREGKSTHAFMHDAILNSVALNEQSADFRRVAAERWAALLTDGQSVGWEDAKLWLNARARGESPPRPVARAPSR
jgi:predicted transcriptional regulator